MAAGSHVAVGAPSCSPAAGRDEEFLQIRGVKLIFTAVGARVAHQPCGGLQRTESHFRTV